MAIDEQNFTVLVKAVRRQPGISQEALARQIGVSFATVNRWENRKSQPSNLARAQFDCCCARIIRKEKTEVIRGRQVRKTNNGEDSKK